MDDSQLERELATLAGEQAGTEQPSEAETTTPGEGEEGQAETETEENAESEEEADAGEEDASEAEDADEGEEEEDEPKPQARKKSGVQRLKDRLAATQAELVSLRSRATDSAPSQADIEKLIGKPPKEEDFKGEFLAFERAQTVYEMRKANAEDRLRDQTTQAKAASERAKAEAVEAHNERLEEFRGKVKDFDATMKAAANLKASPIVEELILDSDKSAHIVYHLAKNPDRLAKLNGMSEREAAREIGRIEARLSLPNPKTQTKAPPPKAPPKGGASPRSSDADIDTYIKRTYG